MKRIVLLFLAAVMVFGFCSCGGFTPKIPSLDFTADAQISYKDYDAISCKMTNTKEGVLTVEIIKPELLSKISLICENDKCTVKLGSLSYDADTEKFPQLGFGKILRQALIAATENAKPQKNEDGTWSITAQTDLGRVELLLDGETGYPTLLSIPDKQINITFTNFIETDKAESTSE